MRRQVEGLYRRAERSGHGIGKHDTRPILTQPGAHLLVEVRESQVFIERAAVEQRRRDTRGPEGVALGRLSGRGPLGGPFDRHAIQADAEITRV